MSWKTITDAALLAQLATARRHCGRIVCLNRPDRPAPSLDFAAVLRQLDRLGRPPTSTELTAALANGQTHEAKYLLQAYDTNPATVAVMDQNTAKLVGVYAWTGAGGRIPSSADVRLVQLADALESNFKGGPPIEQWENPEQTCVDCGTTFNPAEGRAENVAEVQLEDGVRQSWEGMTFERMLDMIEDHCTPEQMKAFESAILGKGWHPLGLANIRESGGPAVALVVPVVGDPRKRRVFVILPDGKLQRLNENDSAAA
jgi:hypothetical protein